MNLSVKSIKNLTNKKTAENMSTTKRKKNIQTQEDINPRYEMTQEESRRNVAVKSRKRPSSAKSLDSYENGGLSKRGFASMDPERRREIARMGGRAAHEHNTANEFSEAEARKAGYSEGEKTARAHEREYYQEIGHIGGERTDETHDPEFYREIGHLGGEKTAKTYGSEFYREIGQQGGQARSENITHQEYSQSVRRSNRANQGVREPQVERPRKNRTQHTQSELNPRSRFDQTRGREAFYPEESEDYSQNRFKNYIQERPDYLEYDQSQKPARSGQFEAPHSERTNQRERQMEKNQFESRARFNQENRLERRHYPDTSLREDRQFGLSDRELEEERRMRASYRSGEFEERPYTRRPLQEYEYRSGNPSTQQDEYAHSRQQTRGEFGQPVQGHREEEYLKRNPELRSPISERERERDINIGQSQRSRRNPDYYENRYEPQAEFQQQREFYPEYQQEPWDENTRFENEFLEDQYDLSDQQEEFRRKRYY